MSMNFGREQALLRQRLTAAGSEERAAEQTARHPDGGKFLGAPEDEVHAAADELAQTYPEMGRAQMTAFVRTLWQTKIFELRVVGTELLAQRAELLEAPDLPFLETLLKECTVDELAERLASDVLGPLVRRYKKLWKDLQRMAKGKSPLLQRAAVRATRAPLASDIKVFDRFQKVVAPLLTTSDEALQGDIQSALAEAAKLDAEVVRSFADDNDLQMGDLQMGS